jgi:hypothetical protein
MAGQARILQMAPGVRAAVITAHACLVLPRLVAPVLSLRFNLLVGSHPLG